VNAEPDVNDIIRAIKEGLCQPFGSSIPFGTRLRRIIAINKRRLRLS